MNRNVFSLFVLLIIPLLSSCLKQKSELPIPTKDIDLSVNCSVHQLTDLLPKVGSPILIDNDWVISATVVANDESGNWSEQLVLEDSTGGIAIQINENGLYTRYPIGQKLYIRMKGLYLANYFGSLQLGGTPVPDNEALLQVSKLSPKILSNHIVVSNSNKLQNPIKLTLNELKQNGISYTNRLVEIRDIELVNPSYDNIYADANNATNIALQDCMHQKITLRTSNYARFASVATPYGKGTVIAIYNEYKGVGQLMIRDTSDVQLSAVRCDGSVISEAQLLTIDSLRMMHQGKDTLIGNYFIRGVVISNNEHKNFGSGNIVMQDSSAGMVVYFGSTAAQLPEMGDSIELLIKGASLINYNGVLELSNIKPSKVKMLATNKLVNPIQISIASLNSNFKKYESRLVKIVNAKITTKGNYSGNNTLSDATGNIVLYTSSSATFASDAVPTITKTFQGIPTYFGATQELKIRHPSIDVY